MKLLFKLFAVVFLINIMNIFIGFICTVYKWLGFYRIDNYFFEDLLIFSTFGLFPLSSILLLILSKPFNYD